MMGSVTLLYFIFALVSLVAGDSYMQNPRGSNNRLNDGQGDAQNQARLFDSQNNAAGGYCWGPPMQFYTGSVLSIEWTNQHGCGNDELSCNFVIQYMCSDATTMDANQVIRDGTSQTTIPDNINTYNATTGYPPQFVYGMHESYTYYQACKARSRNKGLFVADQQMGNSATSTRQNNGATKRGFECAEERDYYPYWHPSPWKDIAVLVEDTKKCSYFQQESQNVQTKNFCDGTTATQKAANNQQDCLSANGNWVTVDSWGIDKPDCQQAPWNRDNHLGNGFTGNTNSYNWTLPTKEPCLSGSCNCVLRLRYNISNAEIANWDNFDDSTKNGKNSPVSQDPYVLIGGKNVSIALNTNQYGRTFEDRSHTFNLIPRPDGVGDSANIYNLNVRGKRGNIVETYPATEYDFVPKELYTKVGDYVHFQWTGCDNNNQNNAGEGTAGTDRSNIVQIKSFANQIPLKDEELGDNGVAPMFEDPALRFYMAFIDQANCKDLSELLDDKNLRNIDIDTNPQNCAKLNSGTNRNDPNPLLNDGNYFNGGLVRMNTTGTYNYMSSRNNNFSNRTQKGVLIVKPLLEPYAIALITIAAVTVAGAGAAAGSVFYAKGHPHSRLAGYISRIPGLNRI